VLRNLPIRTKPEELIACIHSLGFHGRYNFFHMPLRNRQRQNKGYAFIGFFDFEVAESFRLTMDGYRIESRQSDKVISVEPARQETSQSIVEPSRHDYAAQWQEIVQAMDQQSPGAYHPEHREIQLGGVVSL
jgi:RNA recognition motif-containing protein